MEMASSEGDWGHSNHPAEGMQNPGLGEHLQTTCMHQSSDLSSSSSPACWTAQFKNKVWLGDAYHPQGKLADGIVSALVELHPDDGDREESIKWLFTVI